MKREKDLRPLARCRARLTRPVRPVEVFPPIQGRPRRPTGAAGALAVWASAACLVSIALPPASRAEPLTPIAAVLANKAGFDKKLVCVSGKTSVLYTKVSRKGHPYFTIWLGEGEAKLKVFGFGVPTFKEGDPIEACGKFIRVKEVSGRIFYDELDAQAILKGRAIGAGLVELTPAGVRPVRRSSGSGT